MRQYLELGPGPENKGSSMKGDDLVQIEEVIDKAQRLLLEGKPEMSLAVLDNLGPEGLKYATVRNKKGVCLVSLNKMAEAEVEFRAAIAIDREYSPAYTNLGNIFKERGDNQRAIELYERAIQADPTYPNAHHNLGVLYNSEKRFDKGIPLIKTATQLSMGKGDIKKGKRKMLFWRYSWVIVAFAIGAAFILITRQK
jgi:tetratricopeptide (TPR) repeat protein